MRAGLVLRAEKYQWSSARSHVKGLTDKILSGDLPLLKGIRDWSEYLSVLEEDEGINRLRYCTERGYPAGDESFVMKLEGLLGRVLRPGAKGRPRKKK